MRRRTFLLSFRLSQAEPTAKQACRITLRSGMTFWHLHEAISDRVPEARSLAEFLLKRSPVGDRVCLVIPNGFVSCGPEEKGMREVRLGDHFRLPGDVAVYYPSPSSFERYEILLEAVASWNRRRLRL